MTLRNADRVFDTSTTTGTGNITVSGSAASSYITFSQIPSITTNDTFWYSIYNTSANEYETGLATWQGSNVFARTTVIQSSNSNALVSFSAGTKNCFCAPLGALQSGKVLLGATSVSGATSLALTGWYSSLYDVYEVEVFDIVPGTDNVQFAMQVSTDNGSTYDTTAANYTSLYGFIYGSSLQGSVLTTTVAGVDIGGNRSNIANRASSSRIELINPGGVTRYKTFRMHSFYYNASSGTLLDLVGSSEWANTAAYNAAKFTIASGTMSASARIYGLTH